MDGVECRQGCFAELKKEFGDFQQFVTYIIHNYDSDRCGFLALDCDFTLNGHFF